MPHDLGSCCGHLCNKAGNLAYVAELEGRARLMYQTLLEIHKSVGDHEFKLKPAELIQRVAELHQRPAQQDPHIAVAGNELNTDMRYEPHLSRRMSP